MGLLTILYLPFILYYIILYLKSWQMILRTVLYLYYVFLILSNSEVGQYALMYFNHLTRSISHGTC